MTFSRLLALPTALLASSARLRSSGGLRALWLALGRADRIVIGVLLALLIVWTFVAFSKLLGHGRRRALWTLTGTTGLLFWPSCGVRIDYRSQKPASLSSGINL